MNAAAAAQRLQQAWRAARWRRGLDRAALALPWAAAAAAVLWRASGASLAAAGFAFAAVVVAAWAWRAAAAFDRRWLIRRLDGLRRDMDDSAELLFARSETLNELQRLQRARLQARLAAGAPPDLRPAWSGRGIALSGVAASVAISAVLLWPTSPSARRETALAPAPEVAAAPGQPRLLAQNLHVRAPAYTGLPARDEPSLQGRVAEGSRLDWTLRFAPQPTGAELVFLDGQRLPLQRGEDGDWRAQRPLIRSALYRIVAHGAPAAQSQRLHRLDAIPDRPPQLRAIAPDRSLSLVGPDQRSWSLIFDANDDYGLAADASLRVTLAQGSGENIVFRERTLRVPGRGGAAAKRYAHRLDLAALGFARGDDLIVQLSVDDNRRPQAQNVRSASLILRWPADQGSEATGVEGLVKTVMPAYFRSQRQIIIDAEALIAQRRKLEGERFVQRSDAIGVDQRLLRLRYGQFLGEESEGVPPLPTSDAHDDGDAERDGQGRDGHAQEGGEGGVADKPAPPDEDGHDHARPPVPARFGEAGSVLEQFGHTHDIAEAATLLDPKTRALLKSALDEMWQSELHLRQGRPQQALPYAYRALRFIKQVQQASRIYLARVGPELPPIDFTRRLSGERAGLARRDDPLAAATAADPLPAALWQALQPVPGAAAAPVDYAALERWLDAHPERVSDPLAFAAALDAVRQRSDCADCRARLRALLWPVLARPPAAVSRRAAGDAGDRRYFEALQAEAGR
ncbi:hypothetical protein [Lysobacter antibioticus]|uniref:hypothetical protein n=1 Tax=Lysobacter antibioticus TaxID=84531 RepID=UPI00034B4742|nr:hypothetical protein [Lysobacter antibioticus]